MPSDSTGSLRTHPTIYVPIGIDWANAEIHAQALGCGWYLATLTSPAENAFVYSLIANRSEFFVITTGGGLGLWIGGFQKNALDEPAGYWRWVTNEEGFNAA